MKTFILAVLLFTSIPSFADEWTTADTKREATYLSLHTVDWLQTRNIAKHPDKWHEINTVIGTHPSVGRVDEYFALSSVAHIAIANYLPAEYRKTFQYVTIGFKGALVAHNFAIGLTLGFN